MPAWHRPAALSPGRCHDGLRVPGDLPVSACNSEHLSAGSSRRLGSDGASQGRLTCPAKPLSGSVRAVTPTPRPLPGGRAAASQAPGGPGRDGRHPGPPSRRLPVRSLCIFCGERSASFTEEGLDLHYWKSCLMLTRCSHCRQVGPAGGHVALAGKLGEGTVSASLWGGCWCCFLLKRHTCKHTRHSHSSKCRPRTDTCVTTLWAVLPSKCKDALSQS